MEGNHHICSRPSTGFANHYLTELNYKPQKAIQTTNFFNLIKFRPTQNQLMEVTDKVAPLTRLLESLLADSCPKITKFMRYRANL